MTDRTRLRILLVTAIAVCASSVATLVLATTTHPFTARRHAELRPVKIEPLSRHTLADTSDLAPVAETPCVIITSRWMTWSSS